MGCRVAAKGCVTGQVDILLQGESAVKEGKIMETVLAFCLEPCINLRCDAAVGTL